LRTRINLIWIILLVLTGAFSLLYLWYAIFPGEVDARILQYFSMEQAVQGREYQRALQVASVISVILQIGFLTWFIFSGRAAKLSQRAQQITAPRYWPGILLFSVILWFMLSLMILPFSLFGSFYWQKRWGFSAQSMSGWWLDYFKGAGIELILFAAGIVLLFVMIKKWPKDWWLAVSGLFSLWLIVQSFLWPVVISPLYNSFVPAQDPAVIAMVRELSEKAQVPVGQILVMDASRRTTKANAYFSGLGTTKRIVLYDTLLRDYPPDEVKAVVAHEMAHWQQGHILKGLGWGIAGSFFVWGIIYVLVTLTVARAQRDRPHVLAVIMLGILLVSYLGSPIENNISRKMEEEADRIAVSLTGDRPAAIRLQVDLAAKNLSELSPAGFIEWFSYSHPSVLSRIDILERAPE